MKKHRKLLYTFLLLVAFTLSPTYNSGNGFNPYAPTSANFTISAVDAGVREDMPFLDYVMRNYAWSAVALVVGMVFSSTLSRGRI